MPHVERNSSVLTKLDDLHRVVSGLDSRIRELESSTTAFARTQVQLLEALRTQNDVIGMLQPAIQDASMGAKANAQQVEILSATADDLALALKLVSYGIADTEQRQSQEASSQTEGQHSLDAVSQTISDGAPPASHQSTQTAMAMFDSSLTQTVAIITADIEAQTVNTTGALDSIAGAASASHMLAKSCSTASVSTSTVSVEREVSEMNMRHLCVLIDVLKVPAGHSQLPRFIRDFVRLLYDDAPGWSHELRSESVSPLPHTIISNFLERSGIAARHPTCNAIASTAQALSSKCCSIFVHAFMTGIPRRLRFFIDSDVRETLCLSDADVDDPQDGYQSWKGSSWKSSSWWKA